MQTCSVEGCGREVETYKKKGLCSRCYQRVWWNGTTEIKNNRGKPPLERFMMKVEEKDGHWLWTGTVTRKGYGMFWPGAQGSPAHRWSYENFVGPIPEGLQLDHLCRVRHCVNPEHLEPVTNRENQDRSPFAPGKRTHCKRGHEFTPENTIRGKTRYGGTRRTCRTCNVMHQANYYRRLKARREQAS